MDFDFIQIRALEKVYTNHTSHVVMYHRVCSYVLTVLTEYENGVIPSKNRTGKSKEG